MDRTGWYGVHCFFQWPLTDQAYEETVTVWRAGAPEEAIAKAEDRPAGFQLHRERFSSWTIKIGRWSWNCRSRAQRYDLPGPMSWKQDKDKSKS